MTPLAAVALVVGLSRLPAPPARPAPLAGAVGLYGRVVTPTGSKLARGGKRPARPRMELYACGLRETGEGPTLRRVLPPFRFDPAANFPDSLEVVFFANTRPVRVRVTAAMSGRPLGEAWEAHLRKLFAGFDRDKDGELSRWECEHVFAARGVTGLFQGANYYRSPTGALDFDQLDRDGDGRVSFAEFAAYYAEAADGLVRTQFVPVQSPNADRLTHELFALLDRNKDGKLTKDEMARAEAILATHDRDDDECLAAIEIFPDLNDRTPPAAAAAADGAMTAAVKGTEKRPPPDLHVHRGRLPGIVTQFLLKRYDKNGDFHLTPDEVGFPPAEFAALDTNKDGKLSAAEIEAWRTDPPDAVAVLNLGKSPKECSAALKPAKGSVLSAGVELRTTDPGRTVLRVGKQLLDLGVTPPPANRGRVADGQLAQSFPGDKKFVTEDDLAGPQQQFLRIVFDAADADGDGRLTRAEFLAYLDLQQSTIDLALALTHATRTPSLFQLLDENGDGRLSVRELRTAWDRLIVLEPGGGPVVTKAAIQPSAGVRLGPAALVATDPAGAGDPFRRVRGGEGTRGPLWFRKMDRNGDGDVSRAEFLGSEEDFDKIDANADGLISLEEAEAFDKKVRPPAAEKKK